MTLVEGRDFGSQDAYDAPHVAVVNESMARLYLPAVSPLGRVMEIGAGPAKGKPIRIVGVVRDAKYNNIRAAVKPMFYMPLEQLPRSLRSLEVRTAQPAAALVEPVRRALLEVTREIMVRGVQTLESQVDRTLAGERMIATLSSFFGGLALLLASIGLYAVMSYGVAQRTGEIGIRMALGASRSAVLWMVLRQSAAVMLVGAVLGLALALAATRLVSSFLYGLTPTDPAAIAAASTLLLAVAALAAYIPARRATRIDPLGALRYE